MLFNSEYPLSRNRRLRSTSSIRDLISETNLSSKNLVQPIFVTEILNTDLCIDKMPEIYRIPEKNLLGEIELLKNCGINAVSLFPQISEKRKNDSGSESLNSNNLVCRCIKSIKREFPDVLVACDLALDAYTNSGHDGILDSCGNIDNDKTNQLLAKMALNFAEAGSMFLAPSDMMDGRIKLIRKKLEDNRFFDVCLMSYSSKYCSSLYGPFREALGSAKNLGNSSKETYQMDYRNANEAIKEAAQDINEGADIIMVKPATFYLDIIKVLKNNFPVPIAAFQVSGEYSMIKIAAEKSIIDYKKTVLESLFSIKRAGAGLIFTYFAKEVSSWLNN